MHVVVVGAGVIGLSVARRLVADGAQATIVEAASRPATGLSRTTFGWINAGFQVTDRAYHALRLAAVAEWASGGPSQGVHQTGSLHQEGSWEAAVRLDAWAATLRSWGEAIETIDASFATKLEPAITWDTTLPVHHVRRDAWLDTDVFLGSVLAELGAAGTVVRTDARVERLLERPDGPGVQLGSGERIRADVVVIAAARSTPSIAGIDAHLMVQAAATRGVPGLLALTAPTVARVGHIVRVPGLLVRPYPGGRLLLQCGDLESDLRVDESEEVTAWRVGTILQRVQVVLRAADDLRLERRWVAARVMPVDGLPIVGWLDPDRRAYVVVSHSGITLAPVLARIAARELLEGTRDESLARYQPIRILADPR